MQSLVVKAQMYYEKEKAERRGSEELLTPNIAVVGVGGSGNNTINRLMSLGLNGVTTIAVNTDLQHLKMIKADKKVVLLKGTGDNPKKEEDKELIRKALVDLGVL